MRRWVCRFCPDPRGLSRRLSDCPSMAELRLRDKPLFVSFCDKIWLSFAISDTFVFGNCDRVLPRHILWKAEGRFELVCILVFRSPTHATGRERVTCNIQTITNALHDSSVILCTAPKCNALRCNNVSKLNCAMLVWKLLFIYWSWCSTLHCCSCVLCMIVS